ncbi:transcriptional regulator [Halomonas janggokensis]|jgi:transcriptional regulator with XRE-family HTH domain|uniref:Transcriptional regulator n=2 Tax=Oceanospirillales TaxID=135619 RepID=A0ABT4ISK7_9GAMM|nr:MULTISPECIES: transcriptional regulator [unclassified Halomonas]MCW4150128.1 transcriptional regulator [Halomonas sp. 18H]MCZ0926213.1 transcriptional regulator [Halomonas janggokensis]MCZ0931280.1 transcriptional regulator [Halomonas janggokensis]QPL46734.1 transcriptional regulator [Halomonas sp. A40-4]
MNEKQMFAERLKNAMQAAGYDVRSSVLEREFNLRYWGKPITYQAVRRWLRGDSIPSQEKLQVLAHWLAIDPHQLRYGAGGQASIKEPSGVWETSSSNEERRLLALYRRLPSEQRKVVLEVMDTFAKAYSTTDSPTK